MAFITPIAPDDLPDELKVDLALYAKFPGYVPNSFLSLAHKPKIAEAFRSLQHALMKSLTISPELRLMMWHTMSRAAASHYCQTHSLHALVYGGAVPVEKLAELWDYQTSPNFSAAERAALNFASVAGTNPLDIEEGHYRALREFFSEEQIVEMVAALSLGGWMLVWNGLSGSDLEDVPVATVQKLDAPKIAVV